MRFGVLASGQGETLQALIDEDTAGRLAPAHIAVVLADRAHAHALERARQAGRPALGIDRKQFSTRDEFDRALLAELQRHRVEAVVLAGFMRILGPTLLDAYPQRIINVHPSLLPAFPGLHAPARALCHGVKLSGCTVHLVDAGVDTGPIIAQVCVPVHDGDSPRSLHQRIKIEERALLPKVVRLMARGALSCEGRVVRIHDSTAAHSPDAR